MTQTGQDSRPRAERTLQAQVDQNLKRAYRLLGEDQAPRLFDELLERLREAERKR